jgi:hypothetical protein
MTTASFPSHISRIHHIITTSCIKLRVTEFGWPPMHNANAFFLNQPAGSKIGMGVTYTHTRPDNLIL